MHLGMCTRSLCLITSEPHPDAPVAPYRFRDQEPVQDLEHTGGAEDCSRWHVAPNGEEQSLGPSGSQWRWEDDYNVGHGAWCSKTPVRVGKSDTRCTNSLAWRLGLERCLRLRCGARTCGMKHAASSGFWLWVSSGLVWSGQSERPASVCKSGWSYSAIEGGRRNQW